MRIEKQKYFTRSIMLISGERQQRITVLSGKKYTTTNIFQKMKYSQNSVLICVDKYF